MINLNGTMYRMCLVDTNIVSEAVKNPSKEGRQLIEMVTERKAIICFSMFTILELRQREDVYERFLGLFSLIPCLFLMNSEQLFCEELKNYPDPEEVSPVIAASLGVVTKNGETLRDVLELVFDSPENLDNERLWNSGKSEAIDGIISLRKNFPPVNKCYSSKEITQFIEIAGFEQIALRAKDFCEKQNNASKVVLIDAFPSVKMALYTVFYKFYVDEKKTDISDAFDILITASTPYMDIIMTEGHQSEVIRKIKCRDDFIQHLEVIKLKDIRNYRSN